MSIKLDEKHRQIIAFAMRLCGKQLWILDKSDQGPIWHKIKHHDLTWCGAEVIRSINTKSKSNVLPPPDQDQCIVCQFGISHLTLIENQGSSSPSTSPKPPTPPGPHGPSGPDYTPNPPAIRLPLPKREAA